MTNKAIYKTIFYVYAWIRKHDSITAKAGTPYYIGKGQAYRAYRKGSPKEKSCIVLLETNLTEVGALAIERRLIRWYGRKDSGNGILNNRTDGGEGGGGSIRSIESRQQASEFHKSRVRTPHSEETKQKMSVAKQQMTDATKQKISDAQRGKIRGPRSEETKQKIGSANKGRLIGIIRSEEFKQKLRIPHTEEAKQKMSAAAKKRHLNKRSL